MDCLVGGEGTEVGWGHAGWELGVFTAEAALWRNLKHSRVTSLSALPEPHPYVPQPHPGSS